MKKIVSLLLTAVLLAAMLSVFAVPASAEGETVSVTFDYSFDSPGATEQVIISSGEKVPKPKDPEMPLSLFVDWVTENGEPFDFDTPVTESTTIYAKRETNLGKWIMTIPDSIKDLFKDNDINTYDELDTLINEQYEELLESYPDIPLNESCRIINAIYYYDWSHILYYFANAHNINRSVETRDPNDIIKCFLTHQVIFDDLVITIDDVKTGDINKIIETVLERHPDYVSITELAISTTSGYAAVDEQAQNAYTFYFNALKNAVEHDDASLLYGWGTNSNESVSSDTSAIGSALSEGSLTIIVGVAAAAIFGFGGFFLGTKKKKKPALASGTDNTDEE